MNGLVGAVVLTKEGGFLGPVASFLGWIMDLLFKFTSTFGIENIGLCIILFTLVTKVLMIPLTIKQQKSSKLMTVMQPEITAIQKKYKGKENDQKAAMMMQAEIKAVYEKYMGWYDGNPVHLAELTPSDYAQKLVEYFGDTDAVLEKAKEDFAKGEYQWVAQITNTLVFADPENMDARYLCADALEQLGYQAESGPWRSAYLCAAQELRNGTNTDDATRGNGNGDVILHMTPEMILDYLGIPVDTTKVPDLTFTANLILPEGNYVLRVKNGVLLYQKDTQDADADVTWTTKRAGLLSIIQKNAENVAALIQQEGDETCLTRLMDAVTVTSEYKYFNIIEP